MYHKERKKLMTYATLDDVMNTPHTCKIWNKKEWSYLNFEYEYTRSADFIEGLEESNGDTEKYQTEENKIKQDQEEKEWMEFQNIHLETCEDPHCKTLKSFQDGKKESGEMKK